MIAVSIQKTMALFIASYREQSFCGLIDVLGSRVDDLYGDLKQILNR